MRPGETVRVHTDKIVPGGTCLAYHEDATIFVRGALPSEEVTVTITREVRKGAIAFGRARDVHQPSPHRVTPACPVASVCGGCDLQHVATDFQPEWKNTALRDQLTRIAACDVAPAPTISPAGNDPAQPLLHWRTRGRLHASTQGVGFFAAGSRDLVPTATCPILDQACDAAFDHTWQTPTIPFLLDDQQTPTVPPAVDGSLPAGWRRSAVVHRAAIGRTWQVPTDGFWQAHVAAADLLAELVRDAMQSVHVQPTEKVVDLYSGVGLFAAVASQLSEHVVAVEGDRRAAKSARRNLADLPAVEVHAADVRSWAVPSDTDVVIMDPPRAGAGDEVCAAISDSEARAVISVACDGATFARDARSLTKRGWTVMSITPCDLFGMSHHVEVVGIFVR